MLVQRVADLEKFKTQHNSAITTMSLDIIQIKDTLDNSPTYHGTTGTAVIDQTHSSNDTVQPEGQTIQQMHTPNVPEIIITPPDTDNEEIQLNNNVQPNNAQPNVSQAQYPALLDRAPQHTTPEVNAAPNNRPAQGWWDGAPRIQGGDGRGAGIASSATGPPHGGGTGGGAPSHHGRGRRDSAPRRPGSHSYNSGPYRPPQHRGGGQQRRSSTSSQPRRHGPVLDAEGFQLVQRRNRHRTIGQGAAVTGLVGAPMPIRQIFVYRVQNGDIDDMKQYLSNNGVTVINIIKTSHGMSMFNSFKISIQVLDLMKVFNDNFWPTGIYCKLWKNPRMQNNNDNNDNSSDADSVLY